MKLTIENDYQRKVMQMSFSEPVALETLQDVVAWREAWAAHLSSWHSPYKAIVDCSQLRVAADPKVTKALGRMLTFLQGLFLRKAVGYGLAAGAGHEYLPFEVKADEAEARAAAGLDRVRNQIGDDLRAQIVLENHFPQHVVELSFAAPVTLAEAKDVDVVKSKLTNNLMQWHSAWNLLIDVTNLTVSEEVTEPLEKTLAFFRNLFLKEALGYGITKQAQLLPFKVYRSRHKAAAVLEAEGLIAGDKAVCRTQAPGGGASTA